jgi:excisionase family DNA binding protein
MNVSSLVRREMYESNQPVEAETCKESDRELTPEVKARPVSDDSVVAVECVRPLGMRDPRLLTVVEVAGVLGIGRSKVYELLYRGELKSVKIGSCRRVRNSDLGDFVRYLDDVS